MALSPLTPGFQPLAFEYFRKFIYGGSSSIEDASGGAPEFSASETSKFVTRNMIEYALNELRKDKDELFKKFQKGSKNTFQIALSPEQQSGVETPNSPYYLNFCGRNLPGLIAGGVGKTQSSGENLGATTSAATNDKREAKGDFLVTANPDSVEPGTLVLRVTPRITFHVTDTVDFCPGNSGTWLAQILTVPLSRWEASGISGDVTFQLDFPAPLMTGKITLKQVNGVITETEVSITDES